MDTQDTADLPLRAIIGIRNSGRKNGNEPSPAKQLEDATAIAARHGGHVHDTFRENGVSGGSPLEKRKFGEAIARCERDEADMIVWAFRSRNDRSIVEGSTAIRRMDAANKLLVAGDEVLTHKTRADWQRATLSSFMDEDYRLACKENIERYIPGWIAKGWWLGGHTLPLGWSKNADRTMSFDEAYREPIAEAFALRLTGASIRNVQALLASYGLVMGYRSVQLMLRQPIYKGLLTYGRRPDGTFRWENPTAYAANAVVNPRTFDAVQAMVTPRGRRPKSDHLLARLGIVRCAGCNGRMSMGATTRDGKRYPNYVCYQLRGHRIDRPCPAPASIAAGTLEQFVIARAKAVIADVQERESAGREYQARALERDGLARQLADAGKRLARLPAGAAYDATLQEIEVMQAEHDVLDAEVQRLSTLGAVEVVDASVLDDTDPATLADRRRIIRRAVPDVIVRRGRGAVSDRVTFEPLP